MDSEFLEVAKEAAREAGKLTLKHKQTGVKITRKSQAGLDFLTEADLASQKLILEVLARRFPTHQVIAEEQKVHPDLTSDYQWAVDPLDGTLPFSRGLPFWGVSLGLLYRRKPIVGVIFMPQVDELFWAEQGKGSFLNGQKIRVSKVASVNDSLAYISPGYLSIRKEQLALSRFLFEQVGYIATFGSAIAGLTSIACGRVDIYLPSRGLSIWDMAAGAVLIEEAGGKVSNYEGGPVDWVAVKHFPFVATNGLLHSEVLKLLRK